MLCIKTKNVSTLITLVYKKSDTAKFLYLHECNKGKPMKMTHIWKWPNEKDLLYEKNLRLTLTLQTQERSFKTVYNLMIKEKTITNCRISAERGQSSHTLWSILYLPELFFSNDLFCMNGAWTMKPNVFGGAKLKICI